MGSFACSVAPSSPSQSGTFPGREFDSNREKRIWDLLAVLGHLKTVLIFAFFRSWTCNMFLGPKQCLSAPLQLTVIKGLYWCQNIAFLIKIFPTKYCAPKMQLVCESYGPDKIVFRVLPKKMYRWCIQAKWNTSEFKGSTFQSCVKKNKLHNT